MGGALMNIVSNSGLNNIFTGNPDKTFFKKTFLRFTNFGRQRLEINYGDVSYLKLQERQEFVFPIEYLGDLMIDSYFSINIPDIYSPLFTIPSIEISDGINSEPAIINCPFYHQFEFKWIENLGAQLIDKVQFLFDGRIIQEYSGDYIINRANRDYTKNNLDLFYKLIGNEKELNDPANANNRNGNYPNASFSGISDNDINIYGGIEPSIKGRRIHIPINIWGCENPALGIPVIGLQYSKLQIKVVCKPLCDLFVVRNIDYFFNYYADWCNGINLNYYKFYDAPYTRINPNDLRTQIFYFLQPPPRNVTAIGGNINDNQEKLQMTKNEFLEFIQNPQRAQVFYNKLADYLINLQSSVYTNLNGTWDIGPKIITTNVFLENDERRYLSGKPQQYLITEIREQKVSNIAGDLKIKRDNANGMLKNIMFYFKRSDIYLRNEWSNYTNWPYNNKMPFPNLLYVDVISNINNVNYPTICNNNRININSLIENTVTGPTRPENDKEILLNFTIMFNNFEREKYLEAGVYNYLDKYSRILGKSKENLYNYSFELHTNNCNINPTGGINTSKYSNIEWQFSTINPYTSNNVINSNLNILSNCLLEPVCSNNKSIFKNTEGVCPPEIPEHFRIIGANRVYWDNFEYNYDFYISEERYNIIEFSGGFVRYLF